MSKVFTIEISQSAKRDLEGIWNYTYDTFGVKQANKYYLELEEGFTTLSMHPHIGISCDYIEIGYRKYFINNHVIFYRIQEVDTIKIIRVLNKNMDVESHLKDNT
ncbi:Type II toxin-antitoxin system RelE/ParE family toxin [Candidatus Hepatincolaceae symbiont of Richtersius coronifer]